MGIVFNSQTLCHFQVIIMEVVKDCISMNSYQTLSYISYLIYQKRISSMVGLGGCAVSFHFLGRQTHPFPKKY